MYAAAVTNLALNVLSPASLISTFGVAGVLAIIFVLGGLLERATGGWGLNGYFFTIPWIWDAGPLSAGVFYFALAMLFFTVGFWGATIYKRFGSTVLVATILAIGLLLVGLLWLAGRLNAWTAVGAWLGTQGALGLSLWGLLLIGVLAATSYLTLRRATP